MSSFSVSRRSLITFFSKSENFQAKDPLQAESEKNLPEVTETGIPIFSSQSRRTFLQTTGSTVALPFLPVEAVTAVQEGAKYIAAISNNPLINTALNICGINFGTLTNNISMGASLLSNAGSTAQASLVSSSLNNLFSDGSTSIDPDAVKSLCYFFNPPQEVHDSIPINEPGAEQRYEDGMRKSYEQSRINKENFRNDPGVLDFICRGNYYPGELEHTSPEELADLFFDDLKKDFSGVYQAFIELSKASDTVLGKFGRNSVIREAGLRINKITKSYKRPNGIRTTHNSQNPHIDRRVERMTDSEKDHYEIRREETQKKEEEKTTTSPSYAISLIYHFPELEELKRILESIPNPK